MYVLKFVFVELMILKSINNDFLFSPKASKVYKHPEFPIITNSIWHVNQQQLILSLEFRDFFKLG